MYNFTLSKPPSWPRDRQTGLVVFKGVIAWPDSCKSNEMRHKWAMTWYETKLGDPASSTNKLDNGPGNLLQDTLNILPVSTKSVYFIVNPYTLTKETVVYRYTTEFVFKREFLEYKILNFRFYLYGSDFMYDVSLEFLLKKRVKKDVCLDNFHKKIKSALINE